MTAEKKAERAKLAGAAQSWVNRARNAAWQKLKRMGEQRRKVKRAAASLIHRNQRKGWNGSERNRIIAALEINDWKRQDTAQHLGISRKVLWEKMRKYQILDGEPGIPEDA